MRDYALEVHVGSIIYSSAALLGWSTRGIECISRLLISAACQYQYGGIFESSLAKCRNSVVVKTPVAHHGEDFPLLDLITAVVC